MNNIFTCRTLFYQPMKCYWVDYPFPSESVVGHLGLNNGSIASLLTKLRLRKNKTHQRFTYARDIPLIARDWIEL